MGPLGSLPRCGGLIQRGPHHLRLWRNLNADMFEAPRLFDCCGRQKRDIPALCLEADFTGHGDGGRSKRAITLLTAIAPALPPCMCMVALVVALWRSPLVDGSAGAKSKCASKALCNHPFGTRLSLSGGRASARRQPAVGQQWAGSK